MSVAEFSESSPKRVTTRSNLSPNPRYSILPSNNAQLSDRLEKQKSSPELSLGDIFFGDEGAYQVAEFLRNNIKFTTINIRGNDISGVGFKAICEALGSLVSLRTITAEWNKIGLDSSGLLALADLVRSNRSISSVNLQNNQIGPKCVYALSKLIRQARYAISIDLKWNLITDVDATDLLLALKDNQRVGIEINLRGNKISDELLMQFESLGGSPTKIANRSFISSTPLLVNRQQSGFLEPNNNSPLKERNQNINNENTPQNQQYLLKSNTFTTSKVLVYSKGKSPG